MLMECVCGEVYDSARQPGYLIKPGCPACGRSTASKPVRRSSRNEEREGDGARANDESVTPKEWDRSTGDKGDLGVWPDELGTRPLQVWEGDKAILAYPTLAHLGEHIEEGEDVVIVFRDRAVKCEVKDIDTGDSDD